RPPEPRRADGGFARRHLGLPGAPPPPVRPPAGVREESRGVHVVLSTDCSPYQNWQSIASFYGLRRAGHEGPVTRVVSGCPNQDRKDEIVYDFRYMAEADGGRLGVHFTPPFTMKNKYKYANKPGGVYHWMNATGQDGLADDDVLALVDPDMLALRPVLPSDLTSGRPEEVDVDGYRSLSVYRDAGGREVLLRETRLPDPRPITRGSGAGQHFGLGALWADAGTDRARPGFADFDVAAVCGADSPCARASPEQVKNRHSVGPVYVATAGDWRSLLPRWHGYTPRVHAQYPKLLAEMTAFVMAAADVELDFSLSSSYMVSDARTSSPTEAWYWIDKDAGAGGTTLASVCDGATYNSLPHETLRRLSVYGGGRYPPPPSRDGGTSGGGTSTRTSSTATAGRRWTSTGGHRRRAQEAGGGPDDIGQREEGEGQGGLHDLPRHTDAQHGPRGLQGRRLLVGEIRAGQRYAETPRARLKLLRCTANFCSRPSSLVQGSLEPLSPLARMTSRTDILELSKNATRVGYIQTNWFRCIKTTNNITS
ncbi:hypothetical protein THAOC_03008, partial [Thalassiosira oceanica]